MRTVAGRYQIISPLGSGGMGVVHLAHDIVTRTDVAIKLLHPGSSNPKNRKRLIREMEIARRWDHPRIVRYLDSGFLEDGCPYFVMEILEGRSMKESLKTGPFSIPDAYQICLQITEALVVAHQNGVVHRDLKPDNIFLSLHEDIRVKILDFGIAKELGADVSRITAAGQISGTTGYLAPEAMFEAEETFARDIYALGLITIEAMTGERVFRAPTTTHVMALQVSAPVRIPAVVWDHEFGTILRKCVAKDQRMRPTALELLRALHEITVPTGFVGRMEIPTERKVDTTDTMRRVANGAGVELLYEAQSATCYPEIKQQSNWSFFLKASLLFLIPVAIAAFAIKSSSKYSEAEQKSTEETLKKDHAVINALELVNADSNLERKLTSGLLPEPGARQIINAKQSPEEAQREGQREYDKAFSLFTNGDYNRAISVCKGTIVKYKFERCHGLIGAAYQKQGATGDACKHFRLAGIDSEICD